VEVHIWRGEIEKGLISIQLGRDPGKFFEGLFEGGLVAVHEALGAAEALDAVEIVVEGIGGRNNVKIGIAASLRQNLWAKAEIHPLNKIDTLQLSEEQHRALALFDSTVGE